MHIDGFVRGRGRFMITEYVATDEYGMDADESGDDLLELGEEQVADDTPLASDEPSDDGFSHNAETVAPAPRVNTGGGTLFERMSSLSRGLGRNEDGAEDEADGGINMPRFLNNQSNN